jgi:hypothetical protein
MVMMLERLRMLAVLLSVVVAGWWSPCCCQSDWLASAGARLVAGAGAHACGCCAKQGTREPSRDCCPTPGKACRKAGGETVPTGTKVAVPAAASAWVWVDTAVEARGPASAEPLRERVCEGWHGQRGTLVGMHCALVV